MGSSTLHRGVDHASACPFMEPTTIKTAGDSPFTMEVGFVYGLNGEVIEFIKRP